MPVTIWAEAVDGSLVVAPTVTLKAVALASAFVEVKLIVQVEDPWPVLVMERLTFVGAPVGEPIVNALDVTLAAEAVPAVIAAMEPKVAMDSARVPATSLARLHPLGLAEGNCSCI
ncbi:MAG TPA: hypothetical protein VED59_01025 [Acidimicrobiales bacterium]|nr:hypothetical protein [Acidimicrobiales bacterium]